MPITRAKTLIAALALSLPLVGCKDAPTVPLALQQLAGGQEWVAVPAPRDLPSVATWLPYVGRGTPESGGAAARVQELAAEASRARQAGQIARAVELEGEAERVAVLSLSRFPEPRELQQALYAMDFWADRVQAEVALDRAPELAVALEEVKHARTHAVAQLAAGDTTGAVLLISAGAQRVRAFTPTAVALRVLSRAEERLRAEPVRGPAVERALHLLSASRQELLTGDPRRALRRALYALQLAHGNHVSAGAPEECLGPGC